MRHTKTARKNRPVVIRSLALTEETNRFLLQLATEASDALGWTVSGSATVRALLQYATQQPSAWKSTALFPLIEREIDTGILWGSKKK